jgi:hypothetical protein
MNDVGYQALRRDVYKATWSSEEVEHFIYFSWYGQREELLAAHCGIRNPCAEAFSVRSIRTYGGEFLFNALAYDECTSCTMRFSFERLSKINWPLNSLMLPGSELAASVRGLVKERVLPVVSSMVDIDTILSLFVSDSEPCPWFVSNGAIRAAQIVALAKRKGIEDAQVTEMLKSRESNISRGFMKASMYREKPGAYVEKILSDARRLLIMGKG